MDFVYFCISFTSCFILKKKTMTVYLPSAELINAMRQLNKSELLKLRNEELRPILGCLTRFFLLSERLIGVEDALIDSVWMRMHEFPEINGIISLYNKIDFEGLATSIGSYGQDWILSNFLPMEGRSIITDFEVNSSDHFRRLGLVLSNMVRLKRLFDLSFTSNPLPDQSDLMELLDCQTHWINVLHILNVALVELGDFFSVVDVAESMLMLNATPISVGTTDESTYTFGSIMAWWLIASHPYVLTALMDRIFKWNPSQTSDSTASQRLSANRLSFISAYNHIFQQTSQLLHFSLGFNTIPILVLTFISQHLSTVLDQEPLISANVNEVVQALAIASNLMTANSICASGTKSDPLVIRLQWIAKHEQSALNEFALLKKIRSDLLAIISRCVDEWNASGLPPNAAILSSALHIISAFQLQLNLPRLVENEVNIIAGLFRVDFPHTKAHIETVCELICLSCACAELTCTDQFSTCLSNWLGLWRTGRRANLDSLAGVGELIIQIGLQCYASQSPGLATSQAQCQSSLSAVISAKLRLPNVTITSYQMQQLRKVFLSTVLPEPTLASSVLLVPSSAVDVLYSLSSNGDAESPSLSMLATTCVLLLLRSPLFVKHQQHLQLKDWLLAELKSGSLTLDPSFHLLLQNQGNGSLPTWGTSTIATPQSNPLAGQIEAVQLEEIVDESCNALFSDDVERLMETDIKFHINRLLGVLFYALSSLDYLVVAGRSGVAQENLSRELVNFISLIDKIPIKVILFFIEKSLPVYPQIYPVLIRLLYAYFPHLCLVGDYLQLLIAAKEGDGLQMTKSRNKKGVDLKDREIIMCLSAISAERFVTRPRHGAYLISNLSKFLDTANEVASSRQFSYATAQIFATTFAKTAVAFTIRQVGLAARELIGTSAPIFPASALVAGDPSQHFIMEPLSLLTHLDKRVFKNPMILRIALWLYLRLLAANRQFFANRIMIQSAVNGTQQQQSGPLPPGVLVPLENSDTEAAVALDLLQQCESVSFLMDICAAETTRVPVFVEIRSVICAFIHQLFLHNHQLVKLVHFQMYPLPAIPVAVSLIPSMHVCLDFLPELLTTSSPNRQIFSLALLSHIATLYPMPRAFALAKLAVDVVDTAVTSMTADKRIDYFSRKSPVLESLKRLAVCFPPLVEDIVHLILRVQNMTKTHKASSLVIASPWPRAVVKSSYRDLENVNVELKETLLEIVRKTKLCKVFVA